MFAGLSHADRVAVETRVRTLSLSQGQVLVNVGQACAAGFLVLSGHVRVELTAGKDTALTDILRPNDMYIETLAQPSYPASSTLRAALSSTVQAIPLVVLRSVCERYPQVAFQVIQLTIDRALQLRRQLRRLKVEPVRTQIARAVYDAAETQSDGQRVLDRKITQSDIAQFTGLSREAVNKELKQLTEDRLVEKSSRGLEVHAHLEHTDLLPWSPNLDDDPDRL